MITLDDLRNAVNEACTCGGNGPDDPNACPACAVWHALKGARDENVGYVIWHRLNGDVVRLMPISEELDRRRAVIQVMVYDCADASLRPWADDHTGAPGNSREIRSDRDDREG